MHQSRTRTARAKILLRPSPRRSSCAVPDLRRVASRLEPRQDQRPLQGCLPPSHRKAYPAPSSGRARGSLLEGLRASQHHGGGSRAPRGGVLCGTFPSGEHRARSAHHSGVHHQDHSGTARCKGHARRPPLTRRSSPSRRGCRAARLHQRTRAQQGRLLGAFLAFSRGPLRGSTTQLRSHALQLGERGVSLST